MKTIKYLLLLIITIFIAGLIYFNQKYFMATSALSVTIKDVVYALPELPTIAYIGICFLFGLFLAGMNTISTRLCLGKTIKEKEAFINKLTDQIDSLKTELDVFKHDPYIKKGMDNKAAAELEPKPTDTVIEVESTESSDNENIPLVDPATDSSEDDEKSLVL